MPNFSLLDHHVQKEILHVIDVLLIAPDKKTIQEFSRLGVLEEAPLLRSLIWKRISFCIDASIALDFASQPRTLGHNKKEKLRPLPQPDRQVHGKVR